ncbi:kinase-like domain-containing protein [Limtongia smithiae]|uniref:kinase-like domain-containing protein n=1 Tax=Limtongia smithiae TaxID=1125753 RepID=UPI0034CD13B7
MGKDDTGHSSDDSYALPALSSYAFDAFKGDIGAEHVAENGGDAGELPLASHILSRRSDYGDSEGRRNSWGAYTADEEDEINRSSEGRVSTVLRHNPRRSSGPRKSSSPVDVESTTPYYQYSDAAGSAEGLVTPAFTRRSSSHIGHGVEPTSQYRSIFRKTNPGRLGPPKRAIRRESREGASNPEDNSQTVRSGSSSPAPARHESAEPENRQDAPKSAFRLRFSEQNDEIPNNTTYSSSHSSRSSSQNTRAHEQSLTPVTRSSRSTETSGSSLHSAHGDKEDELQVNAVAAAAELDQFLPELDSVARELEKLEQEIEQEPTTVIRSSSSPKSSLMHRLMDKKSQYQELEQPTPLAAQRTTASERSRSLLSPQPEDLRRRVTSRIYHDENRENIVQPGIVAQPSRFQGRQLLTPLSSNVMRPLRASSPPAECNVYEPPPKMNYLEMSKRTPKVAAKKQKNTVTVAGKAYQRLELLGKGGSSKVFKVQLLNSTKIYAMKKVTFDEVDDAVIKGFKGEIELLRKLSKEERVVRLFDFEILDGSVNMVMECGEIDLAHVLANRLNSPLDLAFVRYHATEMLKCVKAVHQHDIVHSDLKPANFLFVKGVLKIIDFGIANAVPEYTTNVRRETQMGTPNYMAPEALMDVSQLDPSMPTGKKCVKVGRPSDVWSCGCIIYQMIYGRPPYAAYNGTQRMLAIMNPKIQIQYPETGLGGMSVPSEVIATIKAALDRDVQRRATIDDMLDGPFLRPRYMSKDVLRELLARSVKYGAERGEADSSDIDLLAEDVWRKIGLLNRA